MAFANALPWNATAAQVDTALEALSNVYFRRTLQQSDQPQITATGTLTGTGATVATTTAQAGGWFQRPTGDDRRSTLNTNDLRGKLLRIHVKDTVTAGDFNTR